MKRIILMVTVSLVMALMLALAGPASATIHPIVESADCVGTAVPEGHPTGDAADPPGQTPGFGSHSEQSTLRAVVNTNGGAAFSSNPEVTEFGLTPGGAEHKLDGQCGKVGQ
jgi:hypothetical protein